MSLTNLIKTENHDEITRLLKDGITTVSEQDVLLALDEKKFQTLVLLLDLANDHTINYVPLGYDTFVKLFEADDPDIVFHLVYHSNSPFCFTKSCIFKDLLPLIIRYDRFDAFNDQYVWNWSSRVEEEITNKPHNCELVQKLFDSTFITDDDNVASSPWVDKKLTSFFLSTPLCDDCLTLAIKKTKQNNSGIEFKISNPNAVRILRYSAKLGPNNGTYRGIESLLVMYDDPKMLPEYYDANNAVFDYRILHFLNNGCERIINFLSRQEHWKIEILNVLHNCSNLGMVESLLQKHASNMSKEDLEWFIYSKYSTFKIIKLVLDTGHDFDIRLYNIESLEVSRYLVVNGYIDDTYLKFWPLNHAMAYISRNTLNSPLNTDPIPRIFGMETSDGNGVQLIPRAINEILLSFLYFIPKKRTRSDDTNGQCKKRLRIV